MEKHLHALSKRVLLLRDVGRKGKSRSDKSMLGLWIKEDRAPDGVLFGNVTGGAAPTADSHPLPAACGPPRFRRFIPVPRLPDIINRPNNILLSLVSLLLLLLSLLFPLPMSLLLCTTRATGSTGPFESLWQTFLCIDVYASRWTHSLFVRCVRTPRDRVSKDNRIRMCNSNVFGFHWYLVLDWTQTHIKYTY